MTKPTMTTLAVDMRKATEELTKGMQSSVNTMAALQELFKHVSDSSLKELLQDTDLGNFLNQLADSNKSVNDMLGSFDQIRKSYKEIEILQKATNQSYEQTGEQLKKIYELKKQTLESDKKELEHKKKIAKADEDALAVIQKKITAINTEVSALEKQGKVVDALVSKQKELTAQKLADIEKEKKEFLSLNKIIEEKFGKSSGSGMLGALMGARESGNFGHFLLNKVGAATGLDDSLQNSKLAKVFARGFDISDTNKKIVDNTTISAGADKSDQARQESNKGSLAGNALLGTALLAMGGRKAGQVGIDALSKGIDTVQGLKDPMGMYKAMWGQGIGWGVGKVFGEKSGNAFSGIVGQLLDALTYQLQRDWDSNVYNQASLRQGGDRISLFDAELAGMTSGEAQSVGNFYTRQGYTFKNGRRGLSALEQHANLLGIDRRYGEDVAHAGFQGLFKGMSDEQQALDRVADTFNKIENSSNNIGFSVHEVVKQLFKAAEGARFLNVDIRGVLGVSNELMKNQYQLLLAGVDIKNPGQIIENLMNVGKDNLPLNLYLQGQEMSSKYGSTNNMITGAMMRMTPEAMKDFEWTQAGWSIKGKEGQAGLDAMRASGDEYMINQIENIKKSAMKAGGFPAAMMMLKQFGLDDQSAKALLAKDPFTGENKEKNLELLRNAQNTPQQDIKLISSSAGQMAMLQASTVQILTSILALIIALPKVVAASFHIGDEKAAFAVWDRNTNQIMSRLSTLGGVAKEGLAPIRDALDLYKEGYSGPGTVTIEEKNSFGTLAPYYTGRRTGKTNQIIVPHKKGKSKVKEQIVPVKKGKSKVKEQIVPVKKYVSLDSPLGGVGFGTNPFGDLGLGGVMLDSTSLPGSDSANIAMGGKSIIVNVNIAGSLYGEEDYVTGIIQRSMDRIV